MTDTSPEHIKIMLSYTKTAAVSSFIPYVQLHVVLMDTFKGLLLSRQTIDLRDVVGPDVNGETLPKQMEFIQRLEKDAPDLIFPLMDLMKLGRPLFDPLVDAAEEVLKSNIIGVY